MTIIINIHTANAYHASKITINKGDAGFQAIAKMMPWEK